MSDRVELIASYWTIAGKLKFSEGMDVEGSPLDFADRVAAAARVGYSGVGLTCPDLRKTIARHGYDGMRAILSDKGLKYFELEFLTDWFADGELRRQSDLVRSELLEAAEKIGAVHIKVGGDMTGRAWPIDRMSSAFAALCDDARNAGAKVVIEVLPWSNIADITTGVKIVGDAGRANGSLLIDIWHMARGGIPYEEVAAMPRRFLGHVELSDAAAKPIGRLIEDTVHRRKLCGEGSLDVVEFLKCVRATGYDGPYGVEIISDKHRELSLQDAAQRSFETTMAQFKRIGAQ